MMKKNYDGSVEINHNPNWPRIPDHPYKILIIGVSESGKTKILLSLIKHQRPDADTSLARCYLYIKDPFESKCRLLIHRRDFTVPKTIRLNAMHYFITKIPDKRELQQIALNHSSNILFKDFMKL